MGQRPRAGLSTPTASATSHTRRDIERCETKCGDPDADAFSTCCIEMPVPPRMPQHRARGCHTGSAVP
jgi:hypothetical protein